MFIAGLMFLLFRSVFGLLITRFNNLPIKTFAILWLFLALGVGLSSFYQLNSVVVYLIAGLMILDGLTLLLIPKRLLQTSLLWSMKQNNWYAIFYSAYLLTLGTLLLLELIIFMPDLIF